MITTQPPRHTRGTLAVAALAVVFAAAPALAEDDAPPEQPKTAWGVPNLQGTWDFSTMTPLRRPRHLRDKEFYTAEEVAKMEADAARGRTAWAQREYDSEPSQGDVDVGYDYVFIDTGTKYSGNLRTSLVVDPPDGQVPGLTRYALWRHAENRERWERRPRTPADRPPATRCLVGFNTGPPMSSGAYNNVMRVFQSPGYVAILNEMVNDHRVIPTDDGVHISEDVRLWKGDSRGRWEGSALVVETRNFRPETNFNGSGPNMHLTERFSRLDADTLRYEYTVDDPESFQDKWSTVQDFRAADGDVHEYACHEGNRAMHLMLAGARREERDGETDEAGWLPSWFRGLPKKEDLRKAWGEEPSPAN